MKTRAKPKPLKPGRTEAQVLAQVLDAARMLGLDLARQNTGAAVNPRGKMVFFGKPGNADLTGMLPDGRKLDVEIKREHFNPAKLSGESRARFERQLARLKKTNEQGGVGFWVDDAVAFLLIMKFMLIGYRVHEPGYGRPTVYHKKGAREDGDVEPRMASGTPGPRGLDG